MKEKLLHTWRMLVEPSGINRIFAFQPRRWRVIYPDGARSIPMAYDSACSYRDIFGGTIERVNEKR